MRQFLMFLHVAAIACDAVALLLMFLTCGATLVRLLICSGGQLGLVHPTRGRARLRVRRAELPPRDKHKR